MKFFILVLLTLLGCVTCRYHERFQSQSLRVIFFDVGQGDAALVRFPGGEVWLIDSGPGFRDWDVGKKELLLELARLGVRTIDRAILSHPDEDHAMGYRGLFEQMNVLEWNYHERLNSRAFSRPVMREISLIAHKRNISTRALSLEERGPGYRLIPLRSVPALTNDQGLVVHLTYGNCDVLFTGDIEAAGEAAPLPKVNRKIAFLKVAHHGSKTSSAERLLQRWQPRLAVISVGKQNIYGHPHVSVLERLKHWGSRVLRTDFHGFVSITIDPDGSFFCESFKGNCGTGRCLPAE